MLHPWPDSKSGPIALKETHGISKDVIGVMKSKETEMRAKSARGDNCPTLHVVVFVHCKKTSLSIESEVFLEWTDYS